MAAAIPRSLDSFANARRSIAPALFLISRDDRVVPPRYQHHLVSVYAGPSTVLEVAGDHDERALRPDDETAYRRAIQALA